ncbi:hypothetical protein CMI45_00590 [Candidatus Pacearchaeota archaeon]|nr:hypothetical protein [Candidatus Pacearchaeota archaeon]|tara:strand:+ start:555 stop:854 length:300 start_codon:yes stop_codon:yes gene_type:complete
MLRKIEKMNKRGEQFHAEPLVFIVLSVVVLAITVYGFVISSVGVEVGDKTGVADAGDDITLSPGNGNGVYYGGIVAIVILVLWYLFRIRNIGKSSGKKK